MLCKAESAVGMEPLPAAHGYLARMAMVAFVEKDAVIMDGYKAVAFSRIKEAHAFVKCMTAEVEAAEASLACEVTSKWRKRPN